MIQIFLLLPLSVALLAKEQPKHKMALKDNMVGYWDFSQDPALYVVHDYSLNGNHLTPAGFDAALTPPGSLVDGKLGKAIEADGGAQFFSLPVSSSRLSHQGNAFFGFLWYKPVVLSQGGTIASNNEWNITTEFNSPDWSFYVTIDGKTMPLGGVPLVENQWYFLSFGYTTDKGPSYVWSAVNLEGGVRSLHTLSGPIIGSWLLGGNGSSGVFDDMAIFRRSVSDKEHRDIYNDGDGLPFNDYDAAEVSCNKITCCN